MALVKCKECGKEVSTTAPSCPHCGAVVFVPPKKTSGCAIAAAVLIGAPFLAGVFMSSIGTKRPALTLTAPSADPAPAPAITPEEAAAKFAAEGGAWTVKVEKDAMSGKDNVFLNSPSTTFGKDKFGRSVKATLIAQCFENKTSVAVRVSDFISTQPVTVASRIDKNPATSEKWGISTDYEAVFAPGAVGLLKTLEKAELYSVRLTPHGESPMDFSFVVTGLSARLPAIRKACGW